MRRRVGTAALAGLLAVAGAGCTADPRPTPERAAPSPSPSPSPSLADPPSPTAPAEEPAFPAFSGTIVEVGPRLRARMQASHRPGCPVPLSSLRHLRVGVVGFDGVPRHGELVVAASVAKDVVGVFRQLYDARWPVRRLRLVDEYAADDDRSMAADNSSAFNCRTVSGTDRWSDHSFGTAIDLNPVENPYLSGGSVAPPAGAAYAELDRRAGADVPAGVIVADDVVVRAFAAVGWEWGGDWTGSRDYQHFSLSGR